jgi:hypothetical protein
MMNLSDKTRPLSSTATVQIANLSSGLGIFVVTDALKKNGYKPTYEQRKVTSYIDSFCVGA